MASQMKRNSTDAHLKKLLDEWNRDPNNIADDRQIQLKALRNIRNGIPRFADAGDFWNSVQEDVTAEMEKEGASVRWKLFKGSKEEKIDHLDAENGGGGGGCQTAAAAAAAAAAGQPSRSTELRRCQAAASAAAAEVAALPRGGGEETEHGRAQRGQGRAGARVMGRRSRP